LRNPRVLILARAWLRLFKSTLAVRKVGGSGSTVRARKVARARFRKFLREVRRELVGLEPDERPTFGRGARAAMRLGLVYGSMLMSILLAGVAVGGGAYATNWLLNRDKVADIELLDLSCRIGDRGPVASAMLWNRADRPQIRWRPSTLNLRLFPSDPVILWIMNSDGVSYLKASWAPARKDGAASDMLSPKQIVQLEGPFILPEEMPQALRDYVRAHGAFTCELEPSPNFAVTDR
jgi:hypothetical protein